MVKFYSSYFLVLSGLTHFICCGIPFFLSLSAVFANISFFYLDLSWFEPIENYLFITSFIVLSVLVSSEIYNWRKSSTEKNCCTKSQYDSKESSIRYNIYFSLVLFFFNSIAFLSE